jgi:hypothetical protein
LTRLATFRVVGYSEVIFGPCGQVALPDKCPKTTESVEKLLFRRDFICGD